MQVVEHELLPDDSLGTTTGVGLGLGVGTGVGVGDGVDAEGSTNNPAVLEHSKKVSSELIGNVAFKAVLAVDVTSQATLPLTSHS